MKNILSRNKSVSISISNETILRAILITMAVVVSFRLISQLSHVLTLIGVSFFLALALNPAVTKISKGLGLKSRASATGVAYVFVLAILVLFAALVVPPLVKQTTDFIKDIPATITEFRTGDSSLARSVQRYGLDEQLSNLSQDINNRIGNLSGPLLSTAGRIGGTIVSTVSVLVMTFMMLVEGPVWLNWLYRMQPQKEKARRKKVVMRMYRVVTGYVNGQVLIAAIAALFAMLALIIGGAIAGVSVNPLAMAGIVFLFGLIPLIGNTLAAVIVVIFSLFVSPGLAIGMAIYFLLYQQIENATLQPYIQSKSNDLTALVVFIVALLGASLGGLLGALAAIPTAGCLKVLFDEYVVDRLPSPESDDIS